MQSKLLRELCNVHDVNDFGLRQRVLRTKQHHRSWSSVFVGRSLLM